jgi:hypothetical protein
MPPTLNTLPLHDGRLRAPAGGILDQLLATCDAHRWGRESVRAMRMEAGDGGDGDDGGGDDGAGDGGDDGAGGDPPDLGEAGKRALAAERQARADADAARKAADKRAKDLEKRLADLEGATKTDQEKALDAAREEARNEVKAELQTELHRERIEGAILRAAAGKLTDPNDAVVHLAAKTDVGEDGRPDPKKVEAAIARLLTQKPYLAVGAKPRPGSFDGGVRETAGSGADAGRAEAQRRYGSKARSAASSSS